MISAVLANMIDDGFDLLCAGPREFLQEDPALALPHHRRKASGDFVFYTFKVQSAVQSQFVQSWLKGMPLHDPVCDEGADVA